MKYFCQLDHVTYVRPTYVQRSNNTQPTLNTLSAKADSQWNPVDKEIHDVCLCGNDIHGNNPNVILTRQTCGQCSSMAVGCKHRALALDFSRARGKRRGFSPVAAARHS